MTKLRVRAGGKGSERGASLVEYALLVALIAVVCIVAVTFLGKSASGKFGTAGSALDSTHYTCSDNDPVPNVVTIYKDGQYYNELFGSCSDPGPQGYLTSLNAG